MQKVRLHLAAAVPIAGDRTPRLELHIYNEKDPGHIRIPLTTNQMVELLFGGGQYVMAEAEQWDGGLQLSDDKLHAAARAAIILCADGDADELTQRAAQILTDALEGQAPSLTDELEQAVRATCVALANWRDEKPILVDGKSVTLEEFKYFVIDPLVAQLGGLRKEDDNIQAS